MHPLPPPSDWLLQWQHLIAAQGSVLDVACGSGRHVTWLSQRGYAVTGVDRDATALKGLESVSEVICADIENGPWPLPGRTFDSVLVTNYLWRPLLPTLLESVVPGGVLMYETFAHGHAAFGKPSRPDFLLQPGELLQMCATWQIIAYECGQLPTTNRIVQRIAAVRPTDTLKNMPAAPLRSHI